MVEEERKSLDEVHGTVDTRSRKGFWPKLLAFLGPAYMVSVGYMDPGNWATDIAGGSKFGYSLLWVLVMSNLMAILLQSMCVRLGLVRGLDLAQVSRVMYPRSVTYVLYGLAELAIAATDLAEVIGMAIGLNLLFDIPLLVAVAITALDTFVLLYLQRSGVRMMEAFILVLVGTIGVCLLAEVAFAGPVVSDMLSGLKPHLENDEALYIAIGIIGATVMPHNLYLHSSLVQTRKIERTTNGIKDALKYNMIDSTVALNVALLVNGAILVLAASAFHAQGLVEVEDIRDAHRLLEPMLGTTLAPILFAVALIAAGQSSTITGTLAGQVVMEGYLHLRFRPWLRRMLTRLLAIGPAVVTIIFRGEESMMDLLVLSQVLLSLQLAFAVIPLIHAVSDRSSMGEFVMKPIWQVLAWVVAAVIIYLNVRMLWDTFSGWYADGVVGAGLMFGLILPAYAGLVVVLGIVTFMPVIRRYRMAQVKSLHREPDALGVLVPVTYQTIAVAVDFSASDRNTIQAALSQGGTAALYVLIHAVESASARYLGQETHDLESKLDEQFLQRYAKELRESGYTVETRLGFGLAKDSLARQVKACGADLLVMGAHGHTGVMDMVLGETIDHVRHQLSIPVLMVQ